MWPLHCHIDLHANAGMFMALKVAGPDAKEPWSLPKGVTTCGAQNRWVDKFRDVSCSLAGLRGRGDPLQTPVWDRGICYAWMHVVESLSSGREAI